MRKSFDKLKIKGAVLLEMLLALAIGSVILTVVSNALVGSQQANLRSWQNQQADLYLQEIIELAKGASDADWNNVSASGTYHPEINVDSIVLTEGEETLGIYNRRLEIEDVFRDEQGNIATQGGVLDPSTKKITAIVSWTTPRPRTVFQTSFLTRYQDNTTWTEDTLEDFADGFEDAADAVINPGYVQLAQTGGGGWTEPGSLGTVDGMAKSAGICASDQYIYLSLDKSWGQMEVFNIQTNPEVPVSVGSFGLIYRPADCSVVNGYLYITDRFFIGSVLIYDITQNPINPPLVEAEGLGFSGTGIWATDQYLFVTTRDWVWGGSRNRVVVYQLSGGHFEDPIYLGSFETTDDPIDVAVSGNYVYVAQDDTETAVEIYDISSSATSPSHVGTVATIYKPTGISVESNLLYLSMENKRGAMFSIAADPISPQLYGYFPTERNTADVTTYGDYGYIAGADSRLKVIEIFDLADSKGISGIYFVYGEYISSAFDAGSQSAFNRIFWEGEELPLTDIMFQTAVNDDNFTWDFVGPNGTAGTYYEEAGGFPLNNLLGQYLKYKMILVGDSNVTPTVDKVMVNYSP